MWNSISRITWTVEDITAISSRLDVNNVEKEASTQVETLIKVAQKLEDISKKLGQETVTKILKNILKNEAVMETMQRNVGMLELRMFLVDELEMQISREGFEKGTG